MIKNYILKLLETMPSDLFAEDKPLDMDLIIEGGAFNGSYVAGILYFLQEMETKRMIKIHRISGCSISTVAGLLYLTGRLDLWDRLYSCGLDGFKRTGRFAAMSDILKIISDVIGENLYKSVNKRLFMTFYDVKHCKQIVRCTYKSNNDLFECILRSTYIPFIVDKNIVRHGRYIDGQQPYFFKDRKNRKMLCIALVNLTNIGTITSTINVKNELNSTHRILSGTLDIHSFFMTGTPTQMCCFKDNMPLFVSLEYKFKQLLMFACGYFIYVILYMTKRMKTNILSSFTIKALRIVVEDVYRLFIMHYCV